MGCVVARFKSVDFKDLKSLIKALQKLDEASPEHGKLTVEAYVGNNAEVMRSATIIFDEYDEKHENPLHILLL